MPEINLPREPKSPDRYWSWLSAAVAARIVLQLVLRAAVDYISRRFWD